MSKEFIDKVRRTVYSNLNNEKFGVSELASELHLSRSQLLRKIKAATGKSAQQLIREFRLENAANMIINSDLNASEISFKTGFSSPSYFNKCFLDFYGVTPGEFKNIENNSDLIKDKQTHLKSDKKKKTLFLTLLILFIISSTIGVLFITKSMAKDKISSIAVLPILDLSENKQKEYLVDGLTEAITLELAKNESLRVISRGSAMKFKGQEHLYSKIANELKVDLLLEGSIFYHGDSLRVVVQLIKPFPKEKHIWQNSYNRSASDIFTLVQNVSSEIATQLSTAVEPNKQFEQYIPDFEAFDLYLKGRHLWHFQKSSESSLQKAIEFLKNSIEKDPGFAQSYVVLAETYLALNSLTMDNEERLKNNSNAKILLEKALEVDPTSSEAFAAQGNYIGKLEWDWDQMKVLAEKALYIDPNNAQATALLSDYFVVKGDFTKAINEAILADQLDPINPYIGCLLAERYYIHQEYQNAIDKFYKVIELNPNYGFAYNGLGFAYYQSGNKEKAIETWQKMQYVIGNNALGDCYNLNHYEDCFRFYLENAKRNTQKFCKNPLVIAQVHMMLGEKKEALTYIEIAKKYKSKDLGIGLTYPDYHELNELREFKDILKKVGIHQKD